MFGDPFLGWTKIAWQFCWWSFFWWFSVILKNVETTWPPTIIKLGHCWVITLAILALFVFIECVLDPHPAGTCIQLMIQRKNRQRKDGQMVACYFVLGGRDRGYTLMVETTPCFKRWLKKLTMSKSSPTQLGEDSLLVFLLAWKLPAGYCSVVMITLYFRTCLYLLSSLVWIVILSCPDYIFLLWVLT